MQRGFKYGDTHDFPPPKQQTMEEFFNDEFFYPSKASKVDAELKLMSELDDMKCFRNELNDCSEKPSIHDCTPVEQIKKSSSDEKMQAKKIPSPTYHQPQPKQQTQCPRAHSAIESVILN